MNIEQVYHTYKSILISLAYRMLGSMVDAEDVIQEVFIQYNKTSHQNIHNVKSYLCKMVSNRCIDLLRKGYKQREEYVGPWLPEPIIHDIDLNELPEEHYLQKESVSFAYLFLLQKLTTAERAVFLLRTLFQYSYDEIGNILDRSANHCRLIYHRSKKKLHDSKGTLVTNPQHIRTTVNEFSNALTNGEWNRLKQIILQDANLYIDSGGKTENSVVLTPIFGLSQIIDVFSNLLPNFPSDLSYQLGVVNDQLGTFFYRKQQIFGIVAFQMNQDKISDIFVLINPDKLKRLII
ncbi:sigma-70 family RNA polymerase sigma factor [Shimazuella sp. AN120528]|uniref:sigma-70 family RNA polymerase sigma factor n=1 Tax=Shimazuella soli TaxID=1892854 RepID=UPI001F0F4D48|nr:sigma-70 family RNA polymerase sigma factor [Shimazuella soli]MCH5586383.1 sigma-70 family RNA polymerase sigma factor [Shimazuella soli]